MKKLSLILESIDVNKTNLDKREIALFKFLNKNKNLIKSRKELEKYLKDYLKIFGYQSNLYRYYSELYLLNYREDGDYEKITPEEFVGPKEFRKRKITNRESDSFTAGLMPFQGSNLEGYWDKDLNNVRYFIVKSYNWYPVYLYKDGKWYENYDQYSPTTKKQMSQANPIRYNEGLKERTILVTREEMDMLQRSADYEKIMKHKVEELLKNKEEFISKRVKSATRWIPSDEQTRQYRVKFKVLDVKRVGEQVVLDVLIDDAGMKERGKTNLSKGSYLIGKVPGINKEQVEETVKNNILSDLKKYTGMQPYWSWDKKEDPKDIKFNFIHKSEKKFGNVEKP
jgi:hypothetical protein